MTNPYAGWAPPPTGKTIASTHIKGGGTTKTTAAMMMGHSYIRAGEDVSLTSWDYFHAAVSWADKAHEGVGLGGSAHRLWPENFIVEGADNEEELYGLVHGSQASRRIIDGGPADPEGLKTLARLADVIILPTEPGYLTIEQITPVFDLVGEVEEEQGRKIDCRVLLVRVDPALALTRETKEVLEAVGIPVMRAQIRQNALIARAAQSVPLRLFGYEAVIEEIENP